MNQAEVVPVDIRVLSEQIYQYCKGVRRLALYTFPEQYLSQAIAKLAQRHIDYLVQPVGNACVNLYFGRRECIEAIRGIVSRPLTELSPEEDFMLGTLLGYDLTEQCRRYCKRKGAACTQATCCQQAEQWQPAV